MKLPNGFGGITKLSGKRRNPYRVRKTRGWTEDGKQLYDTIGYYKTREDAITALVNFNENPYDIHTDNITFSEVYDEWSKQHFEEIVPSAQRTWKSAYNYCKPIYNMRFKDIRVEHLEGIIRDAATGQSTKQRIKSLFNLMYKWALKHDIVVKNYALLCDRVPQGPRIIERTPFTDEEIQVLWDNINFPFVDMILIDIYSGWRPQELAILKTVDINLEEYYFKGGLKTDAGKNRIVPIHPLIQNLVLNRYDKNNNTLFNDENGQQGTAMTYDKYRGRFKKVMDKFHMDHRPHDARHTFATKAKLAGMDEYVIKLILGHSINDVTEKVYTHRDIENLRNEMLKIQK